MANNVVIVESPAKAKTINKYLGNDYEVIASYGHVRDLVNKDGSVLPDKDFEMKWQIGSGASKNIAKIKKAVKNAKNIYLAPDPDREGEAIAWHVKKILEDAKLLKDKNLYRVTFNEITKTAVTQAFKNARKLDKDLIEAYLARRALDYLVGFNLSPILWRKLPGSKSAGRVQSVALRLICERETEIEKFKPEEYWSIEALLHNKDGSPFTAKLTHLAGNKLDKFDIPSEKEAKQAEERIRQKALSVQKIVKKQVKRKPYPPFITSSLQMDASRKLGFSASKTMRAAQRLYEGANINGETVGLITYMRTDGTTLSAEAVEQSRNLIKSRYGEKYLPDSPRMYKSKAKNAQEAHEAIRPTNLNILPEDVVKVVEPDMAKLYELIWKRTMASQMENAIMDQVRVDISDGTDDVVLRANGSIVSFDGFLTLYHEAKSIDDDENEKDRILPELNEGDKTKLIEVRPEQHFTQPPPRYSEASLVKKMEELGIGRPSTYASIMQVLRDRNYVTMEKRRFVPEDRGRIVTTFLIKFFSKYVDYDFTADMEEELDAIASGKAAWKETLRQFWIDFSKAVEETKGLTITEVIDHLNEELSAHFFPPREDGKDPRICPACGKGRLSLKLGRYGAFLGCDSYPDCKYTAPLTAPDENGDKGDDEKGASLSNEPKILGKHPDTGRTVSLRRGPYGPYVQIDEPEGSKNKPKRQGIPRGMPIDQVTLETAVRLLSLPRDIGLHPETGKMIQAGIGRFGPYLKHDGKFKSIPAKDEEDVLTIGMNRAVEILSRPTKKRTRKTTKAKKSTNKKGTGKKTRRKNS